MSVGAGAEAACALCECRSARHLFHKDGRDFVRCRACGLVRVDPMPSAGALAEHYAASHREGDYARFVDAGEIRRAIAEHRLDAACASVRKGRWLDVGCAGGHFMEAARQAGMQAEGLDLAPDAVAAVRAKGFVAHQSEVEAFSPSAPYDTVTAFDVLEHSLRPRTAVRCFRDWLVAGGSLVLTVPDVRSAFPRFLMGRHWFYFNAAEHLFYFDRRTLSRLLREEGFEVDRMERSYKPLSPRYAAANLRLFNARLGRLAQAAVGVLPERLADWRLPLYLGELQVVARRC